MLYYILTFVNALTIKIVFRLGGARSHVGGMLYKIIAENLLPCPSKENRWLGARNVNKIVNIIFITNK